MRERAVRKRHNMRFCLLAYAGNTCSRLHNERVNLQQMCRMKENFTSTPLKTESNSSRKRDKMKPIIAIFSYGAVLSAFIQQVDNQIAFSAVTTFDRLANLYLRMTIREPHLEPNEKIDADTKSSICQSITTSGFFQLREARSTDMDVIFNELTSRRHSEQANTFLQKVIHDYETKGMWRMVYTYRTRFTSVQVSSEAAKEFGFACAIRDRKNNKNRLEMFLVSDAYNINAALDFPTEDAINARFIFGCALEGCTLLAMAEQPAKAFAGVDSSVEVIYSRMRQYYDIAETAAEDSVCGLTIEEKLRICTATMTSSYFVDKIRFLPEENRVSGECQLTAVSWQTKEAVWEAQGDSYKEWMLSCAVEPIAADAHDTYYVSRAYHSHFAVVYSRDDWNDEWYIENISANVSVIFEKHMRIRVESKGQSAPNLVHQLRIIDEL